MYRNNFLNNFIKSELKKLFEKYLVKKKLRLSNLNWKTVFFINSKKINF